MSLPPWLLPVLMLVSPRAPAQDGGVGLETLEPILATPGVQTAEPIIDDIPVGERASAYQLAERDLIESLRLRQKQGLPPKPDQTRVETCLRLLLRENIEYLKSGPGWKTYPPDKRFAFATASARMKLTGYVSKLKKRDISAKKNRTGISRILKDAVHGLARAMPTDFKERGRVPEPPAPGPAELQWIEKTKDSPGAPRRMLLE